MDFEIKLIKNKLEEAETRFKELSSLTQSLEKQLKDTDDARKLLELVKNYKVKQKKDFILNIINTALQDIFASNIELQINSTDEDLENMIKSKGAINIKYDIILLENGVEISRNEKLLSSNGGGVLSIISILLKIMTGYIYSKNKFYVFDESLAQVSEIYQERLSMFLREFCEKYGFTIILVNHNPKLSTHAHIKYYLSANVTKDNLKSLYIKSKEENYSSEIQDKWVLNIQNFQSIKKIEMDFKGFVSITGPNNIGKSATMRALNSIIFNDFQDSFLRQGEQESKIKIDHIQGTNSTWAEMIYKSKKVKYIFWDGDEFTGKKLAYDKIKEKMEIIGFKYLDVSKMYKNWKSDLKNQVDKLYVTTQYDKLFLVGSKNSDSDKIFNFLFNAELIAQAILNINYDLRELQTSYKQYCDEMSNLETQIANLKIQLRIKTFYWKKQLLSSYNDIHNDIHNLHSNVNFLQNLGTKIAKLIRMLELQRSEYIYNSNVQKINEHLTIIKNRFEIIDKIYKKITRLQSAMDLQVVYNDSIKSIDKVQNMLNILFERKLIIDKVLEKLLKISRMTELQEQYTSLQITLKHLLDDKNKTIVNFNAFKDSLGIVQCEKCGGLGYHLK